MCDRKILSARRPRALSQCVQIELTIFDMGTVKIFISTGEVSGDLQGSMLVEALHRQGRSRGIELEIFALSGPRTAAAGAKLLADTSGIGAIGLLESLPYVIPTLLRQREAKRFLRDNPPDVVVPVDYLGPNLQILAYVRRHLPDTPIAYYIAPQMWVWTSSLRQAQALAKQTDLLLAIFPEEARFFRDLGANVKWVGHPLVDLAAEAPARSHARQALGLAPEETAIALFPASRRQEIASLMPPIFAAARELQRQIAKARLLIPLSRPQYRPDLEKAIARYDLRADLLESSGALAIAAADLAIAKSGTVNLELALQKVPQIVLYRVNPVTAWIARKILKFSIPFMSPPNLIEMQPVVPELFQEEATAENILREALDLLQNEERRDRMLQDYERMSQAVGEPRVCDRAAAAILQLLPQS